MRHRRVFIIGAGVSASCGIPVAKDIFRETVTEWQEHAPDEAGQVHDLLRYLYPGFDEDEANYPNIEDFFNQLEMAQRFNSEGFIRSSVWGVQKLENVKNLALNAVAQYIWHVLNENDGDTEEYIRRFVKDFVHEGDTIITFNWDITIERAIKYHPTIQSVRGTYSRSGKNDGLVLLKPHGSIGWQTRTEVHPKGSMSLGAQLSDVPPLIVPPLADKNFTSPILRRSWIGVFHAISNASQLLILGYSLPREDQFARFVLRRAIRNNAVKMGKKKNSRLNVSVVNPDIKLQAVYSSLLGKHFKFIPKKFEDFVESGPE
jgi:hypothetical protein